MFRDNNKKHLVKAKTKRLENKQIHNVTKKLGDSEKLHIYSLLDDVQ